MQFTLTINCDTEAFGKNGLRAPDDHMTRNEVARILQVAAVRIGLHADADGYLHDIHGQKVGFFDYGVE